jgi:hypothetical protein
MRVGRGVAILAMILFVFGCKSAMYEQTLVESGLEPLNTEELESLFTDVTIYGSYASGDSFTEYMAPDGTTTEVWRGVAYKGKWWIENHSVCFGYEARKGKEYCHRVYMKDGLPHSVYSDGPKTGKFSGSISKIMPGNVEGL